MGAPITPGWERLYTMALGEIIEDMGGCDVRRVPGGWIFTDAVEVQSKFEKEVRDSTGGVRKVRGSYRHHLPPVFVPYNDEFAWIDPRGSAKSQDAANGKQPPPPPVARPATNNDDNDNAPF